MSLVKKSLAKAVSSVPSSTEKQAPTAAATATQANAPANNNTKQQY